MAKDWYGNDGNDYKRAVKSGFFPIQWWRSWHMHGKGSDDELFGG